MGSLFTIASGALALLLLAATVSASVRLGRHLRTKGRRKERDDAFWLTPLLCACGAVAALDGLGIIPLIPGAAAALFLAGTSGYLLMRDTGFGPAAWLPAVRVLFSHARGALRYLREDVRALIARRGDGAPEPAPEPAAAPAPAAPRPVPAPRDVPSVRDDPALGDVPAPAEIAQGLAALGVAIPPAWAALCDTVGTHEPDTDEDELAFIAGEAAGVLAYGDAWRARAETLLHGTGLDPAYAAGNLEFADEAAELASALAMVNQRFNVIYGAIRDWVAGGGVLPHKAREFFGDGGAAPQQDADPGDIAA